MSRLARDISRRGTQSQNVMVHIATAAVAVSIAVVIISLSVIFGFKEQISKLVSGTVADITIYAYSEQQQDRPLPINDSKELHDIIASTENVARAERYAIRSCVVRGKEGAAGILLKGIDADAESSFIAERIESGTTPRFEEARRKEILLSQSIASQIGATTDSRVELLLLDEDSPRREVFKVCGIYCSALGNTGAELALTDIRNVQKLNGWGASQISGYSCLLHNSERSEQTVDMITQRLTQEYKGEDSFALTTSRRQHADIFSWLDTHDINATLIAIIMLIVAIFNMVTALLILVLERTRMVGTLKSMGMQNSTIRRIFTYRAAQIIAIGIAIGNAVALALLFAQRHWHIFKLDEEGYFLSEIPVSIEAWWMVLINILFIAIVLVATHLATHIVGRIKVADAIKYS